MYNIIKNSVDWRIAYQGKTSYCCISDLKPNCIYEFRVNCEGSQWSEIKYIETLYKYTSYIPNLNIINLDASYDISLGDIIMFKERNKIIIGRIVNEILDPRLNYERKLSILIISTKIHQYSPGMIIQRDDNQLYKLSNKEIFRKRWEDEDNRRSIINSFSND